MGLWPAIAGAQTLPALAPVRGNPQAKLQLTLYDDLQCPYCAAAYRTLVNDVLPQYGDHLGFRVWTTYNPSIHPWALHASVNANCLAAQDANAFWDFTDYVHGNLNKLLPAVRPLAELDDAASQIGEKRNLKMADLQLCLAAQQDSVAEDMRNQAIRRGLRALPTLFVGEQPIVGARTAEQYRKAIDEALGQPEINRRQ